MDSYLREQRFTTVGLSSAVIAPGNMRRRAIIISAPQTLNPALAINETLTPNADTTTLGVKSTLPGSASRVIEVVSASATLTAGAAPVVAFQLLQGGNTYNLVAGTVPQVFNGKLPIGAVDTAQWTVTTVGAGSTTSFAIIGEQFARPDMITLSFAGPAVLGQGLNIYPGNAPLILAVDLFGRALREEITAISSFTGAIVGCVDILEG